MATQTPNYSFDLPAIGADADVWGGFLNGNWAALDTLLLSIQNAVLPIGTVILWANGGANESNIPVGFGICDGSQYVRSDGQGNITSPNLRSRFIVGGTGDGTGDYQNNTTGEGDGTGAIVDVAEHTLDISEIPAHTHDDVLSAPSQTEFQGAALTNSGPRYANLGSGSTGGGAPHGHPGSTVNVSNADLDPAWYAAIYIMKI